MLRFLLFLTLALRLSAQETMFRQVADTATDTHVEVVALFTRLAPGGYLPVRVKIANNLSSAKSISLDFTSSFGYGEDLRSTSSFNINAEAGKTVTRDILVPICPAAGDRDTCMVTASLRGDLGNNSNTIVSEISGGQPSVLLSNTLFTPYSSILDSEVNSYFSSSRGSTTFAGSFDPKQLPDDWLAFSAYDSVVMTDADWSAIPPGGRNAILSWVRLGGNLNIHAPPGTEASSLALPEEAGFGSIRIHDWQPDPSTAKEILQNVLENPVPLRQMSLATDYQRGWPLQQSFGNQEFRYSLFIGVLVLFGILVGPVNLYVFAKGGKRHRLFITTPIISLVTSLVLVGLIIGQDGFGGSGVRRVLMEVRPDDGVNAAFIHQEQFSRSGVLTSAGFTLETPAAIFPVPLTPSRWARFTNTYNTKGIYDLQPSDGKIRASGDWFQSRSEQGQVIEAVVSTRGRIETTDKPGEYLSTFEFPISSLYQLDASGQWSRASDIAPGKRFILTTVDPSMVLPELKIESKAFSNRNAALMSAAILRPGHFIALTDQAPGIATEPSVRWQKTRTIITGPIAR